MLESLKNKGPTLLKDSIKMLIELTLVKEGITEKLIVHLIVEK